jgi:hypothetical protein
MHDFATAFIANKGVTAIFSFLDTEQPGMVFLIPRRTFQQAGAR